MQIMYLFNKHGSIKWLLGLMSYFIINSAQATFYGPIPKCVRVSHAPGHAANKPNSGNLWGVQAEYGTTGVWTGATDTNYTNMTMADPNITDTSFQPVGTVLSSSIKSFLEFAESGKYSPEQVLYKCPAGAENVISEMYSTNGDYRFGGYDDMEVGQYFGMPGVYSTRVKGLGFRITNLSTGEYFSHNWKSRPLTGLDRDQYGNILVKAKNFSNIKVELIRIPDIHPNGNSSVTWSGYDVSKQFDDTQPLGYFAVRLPLSTNFNNLDGPTPGLNHKNHYPGWYQYWPATIGLYKSFTTRRLPTCRVNFVTPTVTFPRISVAELNIGSYSNASFSVSYNCQAGSVLGSGQDQVSMFFLPTAANFKKSEELSLTYNSISTPYLLSENYESENTAKGVAVTFYDQSGRQLSFSNPDNYFSVVHNPGRITPIGSPVGNNTYSMTFEAKLGKIPKGNVNVTPGKYHATARVVMRVN
ncbi:MULTISPECIES: fimbrial protein [Vibrio]|uniref:fimbrial protein n=1 Tax=Vibrio TaxID=662 RepID=UPI0009345118|nr:MULTISPECIES: fimbrial protein [Vibrio]PXA73102.1 hypothetical protein DMC15_08195 [Vibrio sp. 11986-1-5]